MNAKVRLQLYKNALNYCVAWTFLLKQTFLLIDSPPCLKTNINATAFPSTYSVCANTAIPLIPSYFRI